MAAGKVRILCSATALAFVPPGAFAASATGDGSFICKRDGATRTVVVEYAEPGKKVPCEVKYKKASGDDKSIFQAKAKEGFCEEKAQAFAEKLKGMGWDCDAEAK